MATIRDVAERAGVSKTLVSRHLNGQVGVSTKSKEKIMAAIKELNYRPNGLARSLVLQRTQSIGIVLDNLCSPFVSRLIAGLEKGAEDFDQDNQYKVMFCSSNGNMHKKQQCVKFLTQGRVDGIIIYGSLVTDDSIIEELAASTFPFLLIENDVSDLLANKVLIDNVEGAYRATEYLIKQGHRKIAHMAGNMNIKITLDRLNGYIRALQDYQIPIDQDMIIYPTFTQKAPDEKINWGGRIDKSYLHAGYIEMQKLIQSNRCPEAMFFATDISAFGAIRALEEAGMKIPGDISIIGFDDERPVDYDCTCSPISTMRQPLEEAGYAGIKQLIKNIYNPELKPEKIVLKTELILRDSIRSVR